MHTPIWISKADYIKGQIIFFRMEMWDCGMTLFFFNDNTEYWQAGFGATGRSAFFCSDQVMLHTTTTTTIHPGLKPAGGGFQAQQTNALGAEEGIHWRPEGGGVLLASVLCVQCIPYKYALSTQNKYTTQSTNCSGFCLVILSKNGYAFIKNSLVGSYSNNN